MFWWLAAIRQFNVHLEKMYNKKQFEIFLCETRFRIVRKRNVIEVAAVLWLWLLQSASLQEYRVSRCINWDEPVRNQPPRFSGILQSANLTLLPLIIDCGEDWLIWVCFVDWDVGESLMVVGSQSLLACGWNIVFSRFFCGRDSSFSSSSFWCMI